MGEGEPHVRVVAREPWGLESCIRHVTDSTREGWRAALFVTRLARHKRVGERFMTTRCGPKRVRELPLPRG